MAIRSWQDFAAQLGVSVSTLKRLYNSDLDFPLKVQISEQRVGFPSEQCDDYEDLILTRQRERNALKAVWK